MKISRRVLIIALILGPFLLIGFMFPSFIQDNFVTPIALVLLLGWRIVQSIDQQIYWFVLIIAAALYAFIRLYRLFQVPGTFEQTTSRDLNVTLEQINYWQTSLRLTDFKIDRSDLLARNLANYAGRRICLETSPCHTVRSLHCFGATPGTTARTRLRLFVSGPIIWREAIHQTAAADWRDIPRKRIRRWTGREKAEYYQLLEQTLKFMESVMENEDDDQRFDAHHD